MPAPEKNAEPKPIFDWSKAVALIDQKRTDTGDKLDAICFKVGISSAVLSRFINGDRKTLSMDNLLALIQYLGVDANELIHAPTPEAQETLNQVKTQLRASAQLTPETAAALEALLRAAQEEFGDEESE